MLKENSIDQIKNSNRTWRTESPLLNSDKTAIMWRVQLWGLALLTFLSFFPIAFNLEEHLFFVLLLLALGTAWIEDGSIRVRSPIDLPLLLFVGWILLSIPFAIDPAYSFGEWRKLIASVLVFYWALIVLQKNRNNKISHIFLGTLVIGIVVQCSYALIDFVVQGGSWKHRFVRASAPMSGFQELTTYMVMAIPLLVVAIIVSRSWWQRLITFGALSLALLSHVLTYTRAGWLGMLAQGIGFGVFTKRPAMRIGLIVGFGFAGVGLWLLFQMGYHRGTFDPVTLNVRLAVWDLGIQEMLKQPMFGLGFGINTFGPWVSEMQAGGDRMHLHNTFLMVGVGSGWPALILFVWVFFEAVRCLLRQALKVTDPLRYGIMVGTALMVLGFAVRNLFDYMFKGSLAYLFWIILALGLANCLKAQKTASPSFSANQQ